MNKPICPDVFGVEFGRELVEYLGGDASIIEDDDCWKEFGKKFPELIEPAMRYFENATTGNPARAATNLVHFCGASLERAMRVCENAATGDPAWAAYWLVSNCGAPVEWAMRICEQAETGSPSWAAYWLVSECRASVEWYNELKIKRGW